MRHTLVSSLLFAAILTWTPVSAQEPQDYSYDPFKAEKNLEVGQFHLRRGNYDAAIERLQDALRFKPGFARPMQLLGEAYEKKGFKPEAIEWYAKYLETLPGAPNAGKIRKRIEKLKKEIEREKARRPSDRPR